jgi:hypothetical protein
LRGGLDLHDGDEEARMRKCNRCKGGDYPELEYAKLAKGPKGDA